MKKLDFDIKRVISITAASLWFILLFLVSINVLYRINEAVIALLIGTIIYALWFKHKMTLNLELFILFMFGTAYFMLYITYMPYSPRTFITFWLGAPIMYLIGRLFIAPRNEYLFKWVIYTFVFGLFVYGFLNMLPYLLTPDEVPDLRFAYDIWEGFKIVATLQGIYFTGMASLLVYNLMHLKLIRHLHLKLINFVAIGFSAYFSILLENRTFFFLTAIIFVLSLLAELFLSKLKFWKPALIATAFLALLYFGYTKDLVGVKTFVEASDWYQRFLVMWEAGIENDPRFPVYGLFREQFLEFPLGGFQMDINGLDYAHNLWIDTYYAVGLYPFILLVSYSLLTLMTLARVLLSKYIKKDMKILIFSIFMGYFINFMTEPILEGVPYIFLIFCLFNGLVYQYAKVRKDIRPRGITS